MDRDQKMRRQGRIRTWFQAAWFAMTNGYVRGYTKGMIFTGNSKVVCVPGLNCYSCPGAIGSCPMGSLQAVMGNSTYRISLYVFGMLAAMGVLFGRLICGWMCPFGLFQDLLYKIKIKTKRKNLPGHKYLKYLRYAILVIFPILLVSIMTDLTGTSDPWFCEWICPSGMLLGGLPLTLVNKGLRAAVGLRFAWKLLILIVVTVSSVIYYRPFCKYLCPLGAIYGLFNPISTYRLVVDKDKCISCGCCQKACGMDIKTFENANSPDCIRCGSCMAACPKGAIESTWGKTGRKIRSRCFIDDVEEPAFGKISTAEKRNEAAIVTSANDAAIATAPAESTALASKIKKRSIFMGVMMIASFIGSLYVYGYLLSMAGMASHFTIDAYANANKLDVVMGIFWTIAAAIVMFTGIYAIRFSGDFEKLKSLKEKLRIAWIIALAGVVIGVAGFVMSPVNFSSIVLGLMLGSFILLGPPMLIIQSRILVKDIEKAKLSRIGWGIMSIINCLIVASSPWLVMLVMKS